MSAAAQSRQLQVTEPLDLRFLPDDGLEFDQPLPSDWLSKTFAESAAGGDPFQPTGDGHAKLSVTPLQPVASRPPIRVVGRVGAELSTTCVRCLETVPQVLQAELDLTLFPEESAVSHAPKADDDVAALGNLDEGTYSAHRIDLPEIIREALLLEVSMNPCCEDEAACTERTEAMLREANRPAQEATAEDRWAALRALSKAGKDTPS